jgi:TonB-dependent receptor
LWPGVSSVPARCNDPPTTEETELKRSHQPPRRDRTPRTLFLLSPVATGAALLTAALGAQAQTAPPTQPAANAADTQVITVTGIRRGIESAINVKKNSDSIVEAVSAEDIGKLPDVSIGESIARLPGLSAQRVAGRAQVISVRGLSPDFATTLLNGREIVSTGDNRGVEFDQYPSELLSGVTVYKTPDGGLVGQGLSGTLDMQTVRPLNFGSRVVSVNARLSNNSLGSAADAKGTGNRFSVSFIDQSADRKFGMAIGYAHLQNPVQEEQVGLYEPWQQIGTNWRPGVPAGTFFSDGIKALRRTGESKRDGVMGTFEWRPSKNFSSTVDAFFSRATQEDTARQFEVNLSGYNNNRPISVPSVNYTSVTVNANNTFSGGVANNIYPLVRGMYNKREDEITAFGWNNKLKAGDVTYVADFSYSKATRKEVNLENNLQLAPYPQLDTLTLQYRSNDFSQLTPGRSYTDPTKLVLSNTIYGSGYGKTPLVGDELTSVKLGGSMPAQSFLGRAFTDLDFGVNFATRKKDKQQPEGVIGLGAQGETAIASDLQYGLVDLGFAGVGKIPSWNVPAAVARYMTFTPSATAFPYLIAKTWGVQEDITTAYVKANIDSDWGSVNVRGNVGLQLIHTDQSSTANALVNGAIQPYKDGTTYSDVLPSLNLAFGLGADQTVRVGLAKQMARPRVDQLRASVDFGVGNPDNNGVRKPGGSGGNPKLDPWRATAFDLSYEKYFGTKAYVAAAYFYKDLSSYIYTQTKSGYDWSKLIPGVTPIPNTTINPTGDFTAPFNGKGGRLSGVELSASLPFDLLTPAMKGFGVVASATFNNSNIKIDISKDNNGDDGRSLGTTSIDLPGLSKRVYNLTAYYERGGFEARISQRKRSDFIGEIGDFAANRKLRYVVGESIVDAQIGYTFNEGSMKGLGLLLQVNNLTDESYRTYTGTKDRPLEHIKWGRSYLFGANYKF